MPALESFKWLLIVLELVLIIVFVPLIGGCVGPDPDAMVPSQGTLPQPAYELVGWDWCSDDPKMLCPIFHIGGDVVEMPHGARLGHTDLP